MRFQLLLLSMVSSFMAAGSVRGQPAKPVVPLDASFLRTYAQTRGFMLGRPVRPTPTPDGTAVLFLRSEPRQARLSLFEFDVASGKTQLLLTPEQVLKSIVDGINTGNLDRLLTLYEPEAAFATQPGDLSRGLPGVHRALAGFVAMQGKLDLDLTRVLEVGDLALVTTVWSFIGTGSDGQSVTLAARSADVLRRQADSSWRLVIDNPWGTD